MPTVFTFHQSNPQSLLDKTFYRDVLRVLRGLADGPYVGCIPRVERLYQLQCETVTYIDRDGVVSSSGRYGGPSTPAGTKIADSPAQMTIPPARQGVGQLNTERNGTSGVEPNQPNGFSPIDFLANSTSFSFGTPASSLAKDERLGQPSKPDGDDMTSLFPMELIIYNDLMTDIGGTARFFDQDLRNSVLFGSAPTPPPAIEETGPIQGMESQTPGTKYG